MLLLTESSNALKKKDNSNRRVTSCRCLRPTLRTCKSICPRADQTMPNILPRSAGFFATYHFSLRAREVQACLRKTDLLLQKDQNGAEFFSLSTDFCTKNSQDGLKGGESKVSVGRFKNAQKVKAIKLLVSKLNSACDRLFQLAKLRVNAEGPTWFVAALLGKNTLSKDQ